MLFIIGDFFGVFSITQDANFVNNCKRYFDKKEKKTRTLSVRVGYRNDYAIKDLVFHPMREAKSLHPHIPDLLRQERRKQVL